MAEESWSEAEERIMDTSPYLLSMCFGIGMFLGGLFAYMNSRIPYIIGLGIMILGIAIMLTALLAYDMAGYTQIPFLL